MNNGRGRTSSHGRAASMRFSVHPRRRDRLAIAALAAACGALWCASASAMQPQSRSQVVPAGPARPVAVFGADDRVALPAKYKDVQQKIGLLFNMRSRTVCTAFCVAPNVVATAGHCLHRTLGERAAATRRLLVRAQLRHGARLCPHRRLRQRHGRAAGDVGQRQPQRAPAHRCHQGLGNRPAVAAGLLQGRAVRYACCRWSRSSRMPAPTAYSRSPTTATSRPGGSPTRGPAAWPRASRRPTGAPSRRISPTPASCSCIPATPAAPRRARRCCWKARRVPR